MLLHDGHYVYCFTQRAKTVLMPVQVTITYSSYALHIINKIVFSILHVLLYKEKFSLKFIEQTLHFLVYSEIINYDQILYLAF